MPRELFREYDHMGIVGEVPALPLIAKEQLPLAAAVGPIDFAEQLAARKEANRVEIASLHNQEIALRGRRRFLESENIALGRLTVEVLGKAYKNTRWEMPKQL